MRSLRRLSVLFFFGIHSLIAQVEVFRGGGADTSTYIAPEDTITRAPSFGNGPYDFYRYIENHFNMTLYGKYLNYYADNVRFSFYVERNGNLSDFQVLSTTHQMVASEIINIVNTMPEWVPGKLEGRRKRTLMIFDLNIQLVDDFPNVLITQNGLQSEFSNKHKSLKWFLLGGSVIAMLALWISSQ
ncbi:MAG: hypothetical protein PSX81_01280 [bacterium]|nr:hypothetical protein [bacterium]